MNDPRQLISGDLNWTQFSRAVSVFKFNTTFKSTKYDRYPLTLKEISKLDFSEKPVILDIGSSDGIASLKNIKVLNYKKYYITDLNIYVWCYRDEDTYYFHDQNKQCILVVNKYLVVYVKEIKSLLFRLIINFFFPFIKKNNTSLDKIKLINPKISKYNNVIVMSYDFFKPWPKKQVSLIIAANILNKSYFSNDELKIGLKNIVEILIPNGYLVVIDNRQNEKSSIFQSIDNKLINIKNINDGTNIKNDILKWIN